MKKNYNTQPRSEIPTSLAAPHGWGASGFWTGMDNSRQERVGRTFSTTLCVPEQAVWRRKRGHVAYTGQEEDKESGLLYYKARYYDPGLGRFLQADDLLFPDSSQGMNRLMYEEGNPITYSDPTGQFLSGNIFDNLVKELTSFTMRSVGQNLAKAVQRTTFLNKTRVDALLFKRENYYTKSDMVRGYRSLGDQYIGYIKDPVKAIERNDLARSDLGRLYTNFYRGYINLIDQYIFYNKFPKYAIENSDLARSDLGRLVTRNRQALITMYDASGITNISTGGIIWKDLLGIPIIGKILGVVGGITAYYEVCIKQQACIMGHN